MLIIALVLAAIGLAALVFAVVTSNALVAWVCIGASLLGVLLLIVDALRERRQNSPAAAPEAPEAAVEPEVPIDDVEDVEDAAETSDTETVGQEDEASEEPVAHPAD
ncbi:hypothetical protein MTER_23740 [Mycolicibacter terrae]|uniref:Transmembrane protein n=1 Tax=Mycolicibacter terrae TaxID=1788 RepID=A0AAD1MGX4_9MYCO|nr:hypothetical protein [Mycolicibacter terrae]ORW88243.1 hypothetical protein AWC28_06175 [Mycolicibacter terrae]BBX22963.1 hypothetical protein MTER_23740 [Mycolicibacter terrae]SNV69536.1 transmembrane protein [Mycolicibacter terrae]